MLDFVIHLAKKAGSYLKENIGSDLNVELKGRINPVTRVDKGSQEIIFEAIAREFPNHSVIAEEGLRKETGSEFTWYVDPLDGTVNYLHQIPIFCVSIGLFKGGEPHIGVCFNPASGDLFYAQRGAGAFQNGQRITVSSTTRLVDALVVTGFPYNKDMHDSSLTRFTRILGEAQGIRRLGSAALDLCYVARGSFDGFWEVGLSSWDIAAGVAIVLEAGGIVTDFSNKPMDLECGNMLAANREIHAQLLRLM